MKQQIADHRSSIIRTMRQTRASRITWVAAVLILSGCAGTRSIETAYRSDMARLKRAEDLTQAPLGIAKFLDKRSFVDKVDPRSEGYISQQGSWKIAMTYQGKDYFPVKDLVQNILVAEFLQAGINAKPIDQVLIKQNKQDYLKIGEQHGVDYVLGGEILVLEFVNEPGLVTVTSRRTVTLSLNLVRIKGGEVLLDTLFTDTQRENEGLGVLHSTNIDKLMNGAFKKVVAEVIQQVAAKMGLNSKDVSLRIVYEGNTYQFGGSENGPRITSGP